MKKNIAIIMLSVIILILGGCLVFDKVLINNNEENKKEENISFDNAIAKTYIENIVDTDVYGIFEKLSKSGLSEEVKLSMAIANLKPINHYACTDAFDINTTYGEYRPTGTDLWGCAQNEIIESFSYNNVNEEYKKLFGNSKNAPKISVLETWAYDYSSKVDSYVSLSPRFGPVIGNLYYYDIETANIIDNQLKIEISYLTYTYSSLDNLEVFRYTLNNNVYTDQTKENVKQAYEENRNILPHLIFTYEKENGQYILKSVN